MQIAFENNYAGIYVRYRASGKLFNLQRFKAKSKVFISLIRDLLYAGDCDVVSHTTTVMQNLINAFDPACDAFRLSINLKKTFIVYQPMPGKIYTEPDNHLKNDYLKSC